jgi:ParB family transcriptional regulator, chromosome partitioning protein
MATSREILWLDPNTLRDDRGNVRSARDDADLSGLAATIREHGVLQPLGVRREGGGHVLVYGTRRRDAALLAGVRSVPCLDVGEEAGDRLTLQLLENLQRRDLNDMEKADGFAALRRSLLEANKGLRDSSLDDLTAQRLGLSIRTIQRYLGLRDLDPKVRELIARGELNVTQAQHLRAVQEPEKQVELARAAAERGLSAAIVSKTCGAISRQPGLAVDAALLAVLRGDEVADARAGMKSPDNSARLPRTPQPAESDGDSDADLWPEDRNQPDDDGPRFVPPPVTADGNRVFRIHTVDAFCDEVGRLARALQEGDLAKAAKGDPEAATKLKLALRQIEFVQRELDAFARERGW